MESSFVFESPEAMGSVCGPNDSNISYIEKLLNIRLSVRGNRVEWASDDENSSVVWSLLDGLQKLSRITKDITGPEILMEYKSSVKEGGMEETRQVLNVGTRQVFPKSTLQSRYIKSMKDNQITFAIGPAGTGKTFLAVAYCLGEIFSGRKQKIILTRPVVEAGESLGFLPGDLSQKLNPYLKPLYDSMEAIISPATIKRLEETGQIEISPLAYMRGRSIHNACIILDEAQNTTQSQMKMFLTRIGENSTAVITGDITQIDLPRSTSSGLLHARHILQGIEGIDFVEFTAKDTVRSRIVQRIIDAYDRNLS